MIYFISSAIIVLVAMLIRKSKEKQNILRTLASAIVAYECYLCFLAGVMSMLKIPVDIYTISIINILTSLLILFMIVKKKQIQKYYIKWEDVVFVLVLAGCVTYIVLKRFSTELNIVFSTSDPGNHLKFAMNFVNSKSVSGMYIGQLINGLFIEGMYGIFQNELIYKSFIIQYGINFFMAGFIFWAMLQKYAKGRVLKVLVAVMPLVYLLGYPYDEMLYGFVYLQMGITVTCYLIIIMQDYLSDGVNIWITGIFVGMACLGVSIGYTLFSPPVYISVLIVIGYKAYREKWLFINGKKWLSKKFILHALSIFLIPAIVTLWSVVIAADRTVSEYGSTLTNEGSIYRNLYSDFLLWILPALYGVIRMLKKRKVEMLPCLFCVFGIYHVIFAVAMFTDYVSTYFFYKLNYLEWMLVVATFIVGIKELLERDKVMVGCFLGGIVIIGILYLSQFEIRAQQKNENYMLFTESQTFFWVYHYNGLLEGHIMEKSDAFIEVCRETNARREDDLIVFVGAWENLYWYEALTNQRIPDLLDYLWLSYQEQIQQFKYGTYGELAVVVKGLDESLYTQFANEDIVFENEYAYIIQR